MVAQEDVGEASLENRASTYQVTKSENDKREYKYVVLPNKINILLISDITTEKSAASVDVNVGHFLDPDEVPGIAHFCEHMLFLGTQKYPVENDFCQYLSQHGGASNAYTSEEHTNYHFEVKSEAFKGAIDRFAQFFLCPLFDADSTDRELNAIDSEHQKNILNDGRRINFIEKRTSKEGHVYQKFGTGNLETLKTIPTKKNIDIRELLLRFHDEYYSADIMSVAVLSRETINELEKIVVPLFADVINKKVTVPVYKDHPYGEDQLGMQIKIACVKEMKVLKLMFPIPDFKDYYKQKPTHYVSHLIGHEAEGSLLSLLKKKSWVNELWAGSGGGAKGYEFFTIGMELSEDGLDKINEIITIIFQYIHLLKKEGSQDWVFQELKMLDEMAFRFKDKEMPRSYVTTLAKHMHRYAAEDILYGPFMLNQLNHDLVKQVLDQLHPHNFRYIVGAQSFKGTLDKTVQYYDAEYACMKIPTQDIEQWVNINLHPDLQMPKKNPFIPECLDVKIPVCENEVKAVPEIIKDGSMMRVWYKADDTFYLPKACINMAINSPMVYASPLTITQVALFVSLVKDELNEYAYDAELAGIDYSVQATNAGIMIKLGGYNSKQVVLLKVLLQKLTTLSIKEERFNIAKQKMEETLRNFEANQPYQQIGQYNNYLTKEPIWSHQEQLDVISDVTIDSLKQYIPQLLRNIYVECLITGNVLLSEANEIAGCVEKIIVTGINARPMLPIQHLPSREYQLPDGCCYLFEKRNKIHDMSCIQVYMQVGLQDAHSNVLLELFAQILSEPCFDTLRTKEQLGYIVFSGLGRSVSVQGLKVLIQSDKSPTNVEGRIDSFLKAFEETLCGLSEEQFKDYVESLAVKKLEKPKRLQQENSRYWSEILCKQYHFRRNVSEVEELRKLTKNDVTEFYKQFISPESTSRKKLAVVILGKDAKSLMEDDVPEKKTWDVIDDVLKLKSSLPLYPFVLPYNDIPLLATKSKL